MRTARDGRRAGFGHLTGTRRWFLRSGLAGLGLLVWPGRSLADSAPEPAGEGAPEGALLGALEKSSFAYVSPLKSDGKESQCHAEVWYAWIDGAVVMIVSSEGWKAGAIGRGLDRARIWVGNHGRLKGLNSGSQDFRKAPSFEARGNKLKDDALLEKLLEAYVRKYPNEIGTWTPRFRKGYADGSRVLVRYEPLPGSA